MAGEFFTEVILMMSKPLLILVVISMMMAVFKVAQLFISPVSVTMNKQGGNFCEYCEIPLNNVKPTICKHCLGVNKKLGGIE